MSYKELNNYVLNYIETPNMTGRAIMLDGKWGSGKSFYIRYTLKDELKKHKYKCVIISLYGRNDIKELNSVVYSNFTGKNYRHKLPKFISSVGFLTATGLFYQIYKDFVYPIYKFFIHLSLLIIGVIWLAVTLCLSWFYFKSIEFENTISIENVKKIRKLKKTLIVLEDVERTNIDIFDLFGWVNSLCDIDGNDGTKILLVVNEEKLKEKLGERQEKIYDEEKEKTVMDTIQFQTDLKETVKAIIGRFLQKRHIEKDFEEDLRQFKIYAEALPFNKFKETTDNDLYKFNYREFIMACQKVHEVFNFIRKNKIRTDDEFKKCIFIGLVVFIQKIFTNKLNKTEMPKFHEAKTQNPSSWFLQKLNTYGTNPYIRYDESLYYSELDTQLLGDKNYPLFKFCYKYVEGFNLDEENIKKTFKQYKKYFAIEKMTEERNSDIKCLDIIFKYHLYDDNRTNEAINKLFDIMNRKSQYKKISVYEYKYIVETLLKLQIDVGVANPNIDKIINKIKQSYANNKDRFYSEGINGFVNKTKLTLFTSHPQDFFETLSENSAKAYLKFNNECANIFPHRGVPKGKPNTAQEYKKRLSRCVADQIYDPDELFLLDITPYLPRIDFSMLYEFVTDFVHYINRYQTEGDSKDVELQRIEHKKKCVRAICDFKKILSSYLNRIKPNNRIGRQKIIAAINYIDTYLKC